MRLNSKILNTIRAARKATIQKGKSPVAQFIQKGTHDGILAVDNVAKVAPKVVAPCTALTTTTPAETPVKRGEGKVAVDVDSPAEILRKKRMKFVGSHLPIVHCNVCRFTTTCEHYKAGYQCAYASSIIKSIKDVNDVPDFMKMLAEAELTRAQQAMIFEQLNGGQLDELASLSMDSAFNKLERLYTLSKEHHLQQDSKGLIEKLFGSIVLIKAIDPKTITVTTPPNTNTEGTQNETAKAPPVDQPKTRSRGHVPK